MNVRQEEALSRCNFIINQNSDAMYVCRSVIDTLELQLSFRRGCVILRRPADSRLMIYCHSLRGIPDGSEGAEILRVNQLLESRNTGVINSVVESGISLIVPDTRRSELYLAGSNEITSELCVPLIASGRTIGALNFESYRRDFFDHHDALLLQSLANQIALLINHGNVDRTFTGTDMAAVIAPLARLQR